ncbi:MAG: sulfotransferase domain-containing protein [Actinomycetota bacterium]
MPSEQPAEPLVPEPRKIRAIEVATSVDRDLIDAPLGSPRFLKLHLRRQLQSYYWHHPPAWRVALRYLNSNRMRPSFLSLGPARSGTTLLADYIMQHPCVVLPLAKEFAPFPNLRLLQAQFPSRAQEQKVRARYGTAITGYCSPAVPNLMFPYILSGVVGDADLNFVLILRNPVDRTFSHWRWEKLASRQSASGALSQGLPGFTDVVCLEVDAARSYTTSGATFFTGANTGGYVQNSIYLPFLKTLFKFWDRSKALVINADDFFGDPRAVARRVYSFLDLPPCEPVELPVRNAGVPGTMDPEARQMLSDFFAPLNRELFEFLGEDFGWE